jgi:hypothetical protein
MTIIARDWDSISNAFDIIKEFGDATNAAINTSKTQYHLMGEHID